MYKIIIFDVDGTFYDLNDVVVNNYNMQLDFYSQQMNISRKDAEIVFSENTILPYRSENAHSATEFFLKSGIDSALWSNYRNTHTSTKWINRDKAVTESLISDFAEISRLVLLSSNTYENIIDTLNWIHLDLQIFDAIYCSTSEGIPVPFSKRNAVPYILHEYGIDPGDALAIGDRYDTDLKPLLDLGGDGFLVNGPSDLTDILQFLCTGIEKKHNFHLFYGKKEYG